MIVQFKKNNSLRLSLLSIPFSGLMLASTHLLAAECGVLHFQKNRSSGTEVRHNQCASNTDLGLGTELELRENARVWLESPKTKPEDSSMQIMCQNKSSSPIKIKISKPFLTWIEPVGFTQCKVWVANRLTCKYAKHLDTVLICAITPGPPH
jgi:hypothetical protein